MIGVFNRMSKSANDRIKSDLKNNNVVDQIKKDHPQVSFFHLCVLIFVIGCLIGYLVEVYYAFFKTGTYINKQGMIYGPFNQIYGFGALVFTLALYKFRNINKFLLFLAASVIGGAFEYICSLLQEVIFKSYSWNYARFRFSLGGRTNLVHAAFWGILGVLFFSVIFPAFVEAINKIPTLAIKIVSWFFFVFMIINMALSSVAALRYEERYKKHEAPSNVIEEIIDKVYPDERMAKVYPNIKFK